MTDVLTPQPTSSGNGKPRAVSADTEGTENGHGDKVDPRNQLNALTGRQWIQETKSVWFQRGLGKSHEHAQIEREHPAPFSFQDVQRLIEFFTKPGAVVLDPFVGVGSTLKAAALSGRRGLGFEVVPRWAEAARRRLSTEIDESVLSLTDQEVRLGDARELVRDLDSGSIDFTVTSPPYWGILNKPADHKVRTHRVDLGLATRYSTDEADLANIASYDGFLAELGRVFAGCYTALRDGRYLAVVVGDFRHGKRYVPYHADLIRLLTERLEGAQFELSGITILAQNSKPLFPYGYPFAYVSNVHHQYVLIFRKPARRVGPRVEKVDEDR
jgi:DNA modification methylase